MKVVMLMWVWLINTSDLDVNTSDLPERLVQLIQDLGPKSRKDNIRPVILWVCAIKPHKAEQLAQQLNRQVVPLKSAHLNELREKNGYISYFYPEVVNHPEQAYKTTEKGIAWLKEEAVNEFV